VEDGIVKNIKHKYKMLTVTLIVGLMQMAESEEIK
jgi:hypothetical protein